LDVLLNTRLMTYDIRVPKRIVGTVSRWGCSDPQAVGVVISNLISCYRKERRLVYSRNRGKSSNSKKKITTYRIIKAVNYLTEQGYVINIIGKAHAQKEKREVSYILPTDQFIEQFCSDVEAVRLAELAYAEAYVHLELRDEDKNPLNFRPTHKTKALEEVVRKLNNILEICTIRDGDNRELSNFYCRIFNKDFDHGGRFYRADVLLINNEEGDRLDITINGNRVVEVDYSNLHFRIAAAQEGIDLDLVQNDVYSGVLEELEQNAINRKIVKLAINIMFNSLDERKAMGAINQEINQRKTDEYSLGTARNVMDRVYKAYPAFTDLFCKGDGYGSVLQNHDSELASDVLRAMIKHNVPCLPVHDSFLVERKHEQLLIQTMADCFRERFNVSGLIPLKVEMKDNGKVRQTEIMV